MKACVCVVGWYFQQDLLETLQNIPELQLFIISHKPRSAIPGWITKTIPERHLFFERNIGYDWGAYQQFLAKEIWKEFETIFFLHDDITLVDKSVFQICYELLHSASQNCIIGNGRVTTKRDWPLTHIQCYAHSAWKPPSWDFIHDTVRGSFFATSRLVLSRISRFEILWDRRRLFGVGAGNYSLRSTCGKIQNIIGDNAFRFLSESYRCSPYIIELERGDPHAIQSSRPLSQKFFNQVLLKLSKSMMTLYMDASPFQKQILAWWMKMVFGIF